MTESIPIISIEQLRIRLGAATILEGVNAEVKDGRFLGIIGPNGAGKTTLLQSLTAMHTPDAGSIRIAGDDVQDLSSREVSKRVAVVPQQTALAFDFTVSEIVAMGRTPYLRRFARGTRSDRDVVRRAMEQTDITQFKDRPISEVSGGERQRVLLARALAQDTPVLLLDEPTASLDINHQIRTLELVSELVASGKTVIAAIHDLDLAARYCDALLLLHEGQVLAHGDPNKVLSTDHLQIAFDTPTVISRNPVTGTAQVTAISAQGENTLPE